MQVFRVATTNYINDLSGEGARLYGGRWNERGSPMLYCSQHLSLCLLEVLVHNDMANLPKELSYIELEIEEKSTKLLSTPKFIHAAWDQIMPPVEIAMFGSRWLQEQKELALIVPSAVLPQENNILINPLHPLMKETKIVRTEVLKLDARF